MLLKCFSCFLLCSIEHSYGVTSNLEQETFSCLSIEIPHPFTNPPLLSDQKEIEELLSKEAPDQEAKELYLQALYAICQSNNDLAITLLKQSSMLDPLLFEPKLQLGYLYLWNQHWQEAYESFKAALTLCPCQEKALQGLESIAHHFEKETSSQIQALTIYRLLLQCDPNQADYLYYLGRLLSWMHEWEEAEQVLLDCLKISPENSDAGIQLGYLYLWEGRFLKAKKQFERFSNHPEAKEGLQKLIDEQKNNPVPPPFIKAPLPSDLSKMEELIYIRCSPKSQEATCLYLGALLALCQNNTDLAKDLLERSLALDPIFFEAEGQMGDIDLWEEKWLEAENTFYKALSIKPCEPTTLQGLESLAHHFEKAEESRNKALEIYRLLVKCDPNQADYLYYLGRLLAWMHEWEEAELVLLDCLKISPENSDAGLQLGYLYLWEGNLKKAKYFFTKFISRREAKVGLAKVAEKESDYATAEKYYKEAENEGLVDFDIDLGIARSLAHQLQYKKAKKEYKELIQKYPSDDALKREFFDVRSHTDPSYTSDTRFTRAKEDDPTLNIPVVLDYYFETDLSVHIPIFNRWNIDVLGFFGYQKETTVIPPVKINYNVRLTGPQCKSHFTFAKDWHLDAFLGIKSAWGIGQELYPFISTTRFEPGTALVYHSETQIFSVSGNISSFIIKDFASIGLTLGGSGPPEPSPELEIPPILSIAPSKLLRVETIEGVYGYTFPVLMNPSIEANVRHAWYNDPIKNIRTDEDLWIRCGMPFFEKNFTLFYHCFHSHFIHLTPNYFSYQEQVINTVGGRLHIDIKAKTYVELAYDHGWWWTKNLIEPIGNTIFLAPLQVLTANRVEGVFGLKIKDIIRAEIKGHYYRNTLPYRDYGLQGTLSWFF